MADYIEVRTTTDSPERAQELARAAVDGRLAACAQVTGPLTSVYRWQGEVRTEPEWQVVIKTTAQRFSQLERELRRVHTYDVPEIIAVPIVHGSTDYLHWISDQVAIDDPSAS